jgi:DNA-directed RNA polymerase subunit beta'
LKERELLTDERYRELVRDYPGAVCRQDGRRSDQGTARDGQVEELATDLRKRMKEETSQQKKLKYSKRLKVATSFLKSGNRPEWMILDVIPVIPPELRPLVPLDGGRFATSDLNDLYRRVINRNNRLKKLMELRAPEVIVRNEKRMLQEAVDALFDNGRRGRVLRGVNNRPLKSLERNAQRQAGTFPSEPARQARRLLGTFGDRRRSGTETAPVRSAEEDGARVVQAIHLQPAREAGHAATIKQAREMVERRSRRLGHSRRSDSRASGAA